MEQYLSQRGSDDGRGYSNVLLIEIISASTSQDVPNELEQGLKLVYFNDSTAPLLRHLEAVHHHGE